MCFIIFPFPNKQKTLKSAALLILVKMEVRAIWIVSASKLAFALVNTPEPRVLSVMISLSIQHVSSIYPKTYKTCLLLSYLSLSRFFFTCKPLLLTILSLFYSVFVLLCSLDHTRSIVAPACNPNPCLNGGSCCLQSGVTTCTCAAGYTGKYCQDRNYSFILIYNFNYLKLKK